MFLPATRRHPTSMRCRKLGEYLIQRYNDGSVQDENGWPQERG